MQNLEEPNYGLSFELKWIRKLAFNEEDPERFEFFDLQEEDHDNGQAFLDIFSFNQSSLKRG